MEKRSRSHIRTSQNKSSPKKVTSGRITRNPFLNFLRDFRKSNKHKYDVVELTKRGAQLWRGMTEREKSPYVNLSKQAPKYKKTRKGRRRRSRRRRRRRRRRRTRSRSSSVASESTDRGSRRKSTERKRREERKDDRRQEHRSDRKEDNRREDRHSHARDGGKDKHHDNRDHKRSSSKDKRNVDEYELKYKNSKYEDTRDFI